MRMWHRDLIPYLCMQHKLGMHSEIHKHRHNFVKQHSIKGRIEPIPQIEPLAMQERHDQLSAYFKGHKSPYQQPDLSYLSDEHRNAVPDLDNDIRDLYDRCPKCRSNLIDGGLL